MKTFRAYFSQGTILIKAENKDEAVIMAQDTAERKTLRLLQVKQENTKIL